MTNPQSDLLRTMVREVLRDVLPGLVEEAAVAKLGQGASVSTSTAVAPAGNVREAVSLRTDADIDAFVARVVALAENPVTRQHLKSGRLRFTMSGGTGTTGSSAGSSAGSTGAGGVRRFERGALTERHVRDAAAAGQAIVLARAVVITPLARDRARALGVEITKES